MFTKLVNYLKEINEISPWIQHTAVFYIMPRDNELTHQFWIQYMTHLTQEPWQTVYLQVECVSPLLHCYLEVPAGLHSFNKKIPRLHNWP